ncbi:MAG: hypothetical protein KDL10_11355 [Kiritimatiellae bacterium]|nr:hypothetical protein [Kiritimatiellia bacterium]
MNFIPAVVVMAVISAGVHSLATAGELPLQIIATRPQSRIDAVAYLGEGVVLAGTRSMPGSGHILRSKDFGESWQTIGNITGNEEITCLCSGGDGIGYLLTGKNVHVWKTSDYGETWEDLGKVSNAVNGYYANAYGMTTTRTGTLLVSDADKPGGRVHRSTDQGKTWKHIGPLSDQALYRLNVVGDGIIVNGWAGHVYKSTDDGATWNDQGKISDSALYAIEYLSQGIVLIGDESGRIFRSTDNGRTWTAQGIPGTAADDFAWLGGERVLFTTYTGNREIHLSKDAGLTWKSLGGVGLERGKDWLDHVISIQDKDVRTVVGGTNQGFIVFARLPSATAPRAVRPRE